MHLDHIFNLNAQKRVENETRSRMVLTNFEVS